MWYCLVRVCFHDFLQYESALSYTQLPCKAAFNNRLYNNEPITEEAYAHAQKAWCEFECKISRLLGGLPNDGCATTCRCV